MEAPTDRELYRVVRQHVDDRHPELNYSRENIEAMIAEKAYNASQ